MRFRLLCVVGLCLGGACYQNDALPLTGDKAVASVTLSPPDTTLTAGDSVEVRALLRDGSGAEVPGDIAVSWSISDSTVVRLTWTSGRSARIRAVAPGIAVLQALAQGKAGTSTLTVH